MIRKYILTLFLYNTLLLLCVSISASGQHVKPPLPQLPFHWEDFSIQKHYTTLKINHKTIDSAVIHPFQTRPGKGAVRQDLQNAILSGQPRLYPFEYQYSVVSSPGKKYYLVYRYEYSQPVLQAHFKILNSDFSVQQNFSLSVDDGTTSHGYYVDDRGNVYAVYTESDDAVYVLRYQPANQASDLLEIGSDITKRNRFVLATAGEGIVFLANVSEDNNHNWKGVMFTTFDFDHKRIQNMFFFPAETLQEKLSKKMPDGHYELIEVQIHDTTRTIVLQKVAIQANRYIYDPFAVNDPLVWTSRKQQVQYGEKITLTISSDNKVLQNRIEDIFLTKEL